MIRTLSATLLALISINTFAAVSMPFGWYLEGNGGESRATGKSYPTTTSGKGFGWNADVGYKFSPFAAVEAGYSRFYATRIKDYLGNYIAQDRHYAYIADAKGMYPLANTGLELFLKIGITRINSKTTITNSTLYNASGLSLNQGTYLSTGAFVGAGAAYALTPNLSTNIQWGRVKGNSHTGNIDLYTVGLNYLLA